jgi:hypothetical protein
MQFNPVGLSRPSKVDPSRLSAEHALRLMFKVTTPKDDAAADPWMVVERPIVVISQEVMQIYIEESIARDDMPPQQIWLILTTDDDVGPSTEYSSYFPQQIHKLP